MLKYRYTHIYTVCFIWPFGEKTRSKPMSLMFNLKSTTYMFYDHPMLVMSVGNVHHKYEVQRALIKAVQNLKRKIFPLQIGCGFHSESANIHKPLPIWSGVKSKCVSKCDLRGGLTWALKYDCPVWKNFSMLSNDCLI